MTHNARQRFRASAKQKLRDEDADDSAFSSRAANPKLGKSKAKALDLERTAALISRIAALQDKLYAQHKQKVLLILQGMDTSGKDGTVRAMFSGISPMGIRAAAFKAPTDNELAHDYLWRVHQQVPVKGEIAIFNRSHYEDVLILLRQQAYIDGEWCDAERRPRGRDQPGHRRIAGHRAAHGRGKRGARSRPPNAAWPAWRKKTAQGTRLILRKWNDLMLENADDLAPS
jgi:hypothetical protein